MDVIIQIVVFVALLAVGYLAGRRAEAKHYRSIIAREKALGAILVFPERLPPAIHPAPASQLVSGSVVISVDYFKRFVAGLRMIIGGRLTSYESLLDRARREAVLRMKEEAQALGADQVFNVKFETASISKGASKSIGSVEVLAYGTALIPRTRAAARH
ncbi:MAG: YbjQ family protein [Rhodocyclales bacterium]|nr:YbjQ family protein [Rhodocyclales bacterium]